jgi:hypothetical protein
MNIIHFILPLSINLASAIVIIITVERQRASIQKQISNRQHLREQRRHYSHFIFTPIVLVLLAVPRLIISFVSPLRTFVIYILPSKIYKKEFDALVYKSQRFLEDKRSKQIQTLYVIVS